MENRSEPLKEMLTRFGVSIPIFPVSGTLYYQGDVQWENQVRRKRNRQNLFVIWILWPCRDEVKRNIRVWKAAYNPLCSNDLWGVKRFRQAVENAFPQL